MNNKTPDNKINQDEVVGVYPTSYSQQGIWLINQMDPDSPAYSIPFAFRMQGSVDVAALQNSINEIVRRHEAFRTSFDYVDDTPVQVVTDQLHIDIPLVDLSNLSEEKREHALSELLDEESKRVFDLSRGPLICASIIRLSNNEHILRLNIHHIIVDHLSIVQFARELTTLYSAYKHGSASPLSTPKLHYADYTVWQKEWQSPEALSNKLAFWEQQKTLLDNVLQIPTDNPRPPAQDLRGVESRFVLPAQLVTSLKELSRGEAVSMYITMLAAYKVLLRHYTNQSVISVGCPYANRGQQVELEDVMGCFVNTLPLVTELSTEHTFKDVLKLVRKSVFSVNAHQEVPFELIVEELQPTRHIGYNPMFQVGFMLQDPPMEITLDGLAVKSLQLHNQSAKFDMMIWLWDQDNGTIEGILEYSTNLWNETTIKRFTEHYQTLLASIVKTPDLPIDQLTMLTQDEQQRLLVDWNDTTADYPADTPLHQLIEEQVKRTPDALAVQYNQTQLSYTELNQRANQLAHWLLKQGVKPNTLVGISMNRNTDMLVALMGILKAGAAYLPLDPSFPTQRIAYMMEDADVSILITEEELIGVLPVTESTIICMDRDREHWLQESTETPVINHSPTDLAYIIYTSGSTGKPKGVEVCHQNVVNLLTSMQAESGISSGDKSLAIVTISFDLSVLELFLPLISGASIILADKDTAVDGFELCDLIEENDINIIQATPATWRMLLMANWKGGKSSKAFCGGEALPVDLIEPLIQRARAGFWNMYGPTEATVLSICQRLNSAKDKPYIGRPINNTSIYILDAQMNPVPIGIPGELYIGGAGVALGYHKRDDLTAERFIPDPFSSQTGARLYRTGDLAKYSEDGNIEYIRRIDNQVKVRGFRIELGEIESALSNHDAIHQAVVEVREEHHGDARLVSFIVYKEGQHCTATEFRQFLKTQLPDYMVPTLYIDLQSFPLTPSGKVDRKALPNPFGSLQQGGEHVEPRTHAEKVIATLWQNALGREKVSLYDNFFDLGGHSLLAMQVTNRIKTELGESISPLAMVMDTLEQVAALCPNNITEAVAKDNRQATKETQKTSSIKSKLKSLFGKKK